MKKLLTSFLVFVFLSVLSCSSPEKKTFVVINFDVEDYITPESEGLDEIPKFLAEIMSEEGVTGTFFVIGEKARSFEKRGRKDVIEAMAKHDIGGHTNLGSIHPTVTERLETAGWDDGVHQMLKQESLGFEELERIFGKPIRTLARHGGSYGPQLVYALAKMNASYTGSPVHLPGRSVVWFCNTLNFNGQYAGFDNAYFRDDLFEPLLDSLKIRLPKIAQEVDVISFFAGHPCKMRTIQFWDLNYYLGANPDSSDWIIPELRPLESMKTVQKNFRRLVQFLKSQDYIEITTFRSLKKRYSRQKKYMRIGELREIAERTLDENCIPLDDYFSPAEVFGGLVESIIKYRKKNLLPKKIKRISTLGPMKMPNPDPEISRVTINQVYGLAQEANDIIQKNGTLPSSLKVDNRRIGTGSLYALFCAVYLDMGLKKLADEYSVPSFDAYPKVNEEAIIKKLIGFKNWPVHRPDLDMSRLVEMTRMQLWTLKPAHNR